MSPFSLARRFDEHAPEMVDRPDPDPVLLEGEMKNLRIINRRLGGLSAVRRAVLPLAMRADPARPLQILDLATGSGDQPVALAQTLRRLRRPAVITAVDRNDRVLATAREFAAGFEEIRFERVDILAPPYPDGSFDIVVCSLALHHFSWTNAVRILRHMDRLSTIGFVLCDLSRSALAVAGAWLYTRLTTRNIMTHTDAIASVLASFTKEELTSLAADAGISPMCITTAPAFRLVAVRQKSRVK